MSKFKLFFSKVPKLVWTVGSASAVAAINYSIIHNSFVFFAILVLFAHEISHYFIAKKEGAKVSLPFFIPLPFIAIGFTKISGLSNKSKMKVALSGPLVGFLTATLIFFLNIIFKFTSSFALAFLALGELVFNYIGTDGSKYRSAKRNVSLCTS